MPSKNILIVDDDMEFCDELAEALKEEGYCPECVSDPVKGEGLIMNGAYNTVLLDYKMPFLTGIDILKKLKAKNIKRRIFIVTGRPFVDQMLRKEKLQDMISGVISKPVNFEELLQEIKNR